VQQVAQGIFAAGSTLNASDVAVTVDDDIDGVRLGFVHGGQVCVFDEDNGTGARAFLQILLHRLLRLADAYGQHHQALVGELVRDLVHQRLFPAAVGHHVVQNSSRATLPWTD
jgi:hypothetical protein